MARCAHCGAEFRLLTIFDKDMQGLCNVWQRRHEKACAKRTPQQRIKWAKPYIGKDQYESSIVVDLEHPGLLTASADHAYESAEDWYAALVQVARSHDNQNAVRDFDGWTYDWKLYAPESTYYAEFPGHKDSNKNSPTEAQ